MLLPLAATALETAKAIPPATWLKLGIGIAAFVIAVIVLRKVAQMNKVVLGVVVCVVLSIVFFSWVYHRNEPKWLTPVVDKIAPFFPSAGHFDKAQKKAP